MPTLSPKRPLLLRGYRHGSWDHCGGLFSPGRRPRPSYPDSSGSGPSLPGSLQRHNGPQDDQSHILCHYWKQTCSRQSPTQMVILLLLTSVLCKLWVGQDLFAELEAISVLFVFITSLSKSQKTHIRSQGNNRQTDDGCPPCRSWQGVSYQQHLHPVNNWGQYFYTLFHGTHSEKGLRLILVRNTDHLLVLMWHNYSNRTISISNFLSGINPEYSSS